MANIVSDIKHSARVLAGHPGFTVVAALTLAIGIGANAAIFSIVDRVLLQPLPYPESERIMRLRRHFPAGEGDSISPTKYNAWKKAKAFQAITAYDFGAAAMNLGITDRPDPLKVVHVSWGFFDVFGVKPLIGRTFTEEEDVPQGPKLVVLTYPLWKTRFHSDRSLIGGKIILSGEPYTVLGVLPEGFQPDPPCDLFLPHQIDPNSTNQGHMMLVAARLKPGATIQSASAELKVIGEQFRAQFPKFVDPKEGISVVPLRVAIGGDVRLPLLILTGAVGFVLLMACANVANLLLARAAGRQREIAIRTALGAGRGRIVSQLLTESMMLAALGGALGLLIGSVGVKLLLTLGGTQIPRITDPEHLAAPVSLLDWRALAFLFTVTLVTGVLFGLLPALRVSKLDVNSVIKESGSRAGTSLKHNRLRSALVMIEIALAVILVAGAALMIRTLAGLKQVKPGVDTANVLTFETPVTSQRYDTTGQVAAMIRQATERIEGLPGVQSAAAVIMVPLGHGGVDMPFSVVGRAPKEGEWEGDEQWRFVSPHYFNTLHVAVTAGRDFDFRDTSASEHVVIVNEAFVKKYFNGQDAVGKQLLIGHGLGPDFEEPARQIVGVVGNMTEAGLDNGMVPAMYVPQAQVTEKITKLAQSLLPLAWVVRVSGDGNGAAAAIRHEFEAIDPMISPAKSTPLAQILSESTGREQFNTLLLAIFAGVALLLAAVGIYGLMSYAVEQRTQEIGIRVALGASPGQMLNMVLRQTALLAGVGVAAGVAAAYGLTRLLAGMVFGVKTTDPWTYGSVALLLMIVALVAGLIPAARATRIDPILALRHE